MVYTRRSIKFDQLFNGGEYLICVTYVISPKEVVEVCKRYESVRLLLGCTDEAKSLPHLHLSDGRCPPLEQG
ncbi:hypothetical protein DRP77_02620 [Candidatus Poribacteria bacterium]|nr:MAG: hypothetical protein DRP77_02620 [Candidatus Poribacteria bacterium]